MREAIKEFFGWWPLFVVVSVVICIIAAIKESQKSIYNYSEPDDIIQILQKYDDFNYRFRWSHRGLDGLSIRTFHAKFCDDYSLPFSAGETLVWLRYLDRGDCWEIKDRDYGYKFLRDDYDAVILSTNCKAVNGQVVCDPPNVGIFPEEEEQK